MQIGGRQPGHVLPARPVGFRLSRAKSDENRSPANRERIPADCDQAAGEKAAALLFGGAIGLLALTWGGLRMGDWRGEQVNRQSGGRQSWSYPEFRHFGFGGVALCAYEPRWPIRQRDPSLSQAGRYLRPGGRLCRSSVLSVQPTFSENRRCQTQSVIAFQEQRAQMEQQQAKMRAQAEKQRAEMTAQAEEAAA